MDLQDEVDLLKNIPLFRNIDSKQLKLIAFTSDRIIFQPGQNLFSQGDEGDAAYIIISGEASVLIASPEGEDDIEIASVKENEIVGEIAILCDVPRTATVKAVTKLIVIKITKEIFFQLTTQFPQMSLEIMRELALRLDRTNHKLQESIIKKKSTQG